MIAETPIAATCKLYEAGQMIHCPGMCGTPLMKVDEQCRALACIGTTERHPERGRTVIKCRGCRQQVTIESWPVGAA